MHPHCRIDKNAAWKKIAFYFNGCLVTYWPSTELSIRTCTCVNNRCIWSRYRGITFTLWTWLISMQTPTGSRCMSNNYITRCHRQFQLVWVCELVFEAGRVQFEAVSSSCCWREDAVVRAIARQRAWALRTPVEQPSRMRKKCCYSQRNLGSICCSFFSVSNSPLTHNPFATLSRIKCERYIFRKKCVRSSLSLIMFPHIYAYSCICITGMQQSDFHMIDNR